ncbi:WD repeat-containing protein 33 [Cichlidogyrus casuarinus]|uniref:WD repeat-containing protein 33 n=1 Tax=Cichlidogyrus casuarinus TaxID=1844966 RepID=A0ABD2Q0S2_9PLAT
MAEIAAQNDTTDPFSLDSKCQRKTAFRRTIDYNASAITYLKDRVRIFKRSDVRSIQADDLYNFKLSVPNVETEPAAACITSKLIRTATNKNRCPIYCVSWTPEGRRLITGACSGEFTLWNGLTFNFETILQAHDSQIRCMKWSHNGEWLLTADHSGYIKYWQAFMNNVQVYQAHKEPIRGVSFCPLDAKFVSCSDDSTVRIWDFNRCTEERVLRGHGADVRCVAWHPQLSLIISGSKDAQQPIKLWEPKTGESLATLYVHKSTCTDVTWNKNGNWFLTASRDHSIKLFDIRSLKKELQTFKGHKRDVMRVVWHPVHEELFASGGGDGAVRFWNVGTDQELAAIEDAHEAMIWSLAWHPLGHILVSGGNDFSTKFWSRDRPKEVAKDAAVPAQAAGLATLLNDPINLPTSNKTQPQQLENGDSELPKATAKASHYESIEQDFAEEAFVVDRLDFSQMSIPGLNEGVVKNQNVRAIDLAAEHARQRLAKSIPRDFAHNWAINNSNSLSKSMPVAQDHRDMYAVAVGVAAASVTHPGGKRPMEDQDLRHSSMDMDMHPPHMYRGGRMPPYRGPPPPGYYPPGPYAPPSKRPSHGHPPPHWGPPHPHWGHYPPGPHAPPIRRPW